MQRVFASSFFPKVSATSPAFGLTNIYERAKKGQLVTRHLSHTTPVMFMGPRNFTDGETAVRVVDETESFDDVRRDLQALLKEEIETKLSPGILEEHSTEFLKIANAQVREDDKEVKVDWSADGYAISVTYAKPEEPINADGEGLGIDIVNDLDDQNLDIDHLEDSKPWNNKRQENALVEEEEDVDGKQEEDEEQNEEDEEDEEEFDEDEEEEEEQVLFDVQVTRKQGAKSTSSVGALSTNPIGFLCMAGADNRLYVEQIFLSESPALNFGSLAEPVQDRIYDFLDGIKVDDRFGFFMRRTYYRVKREHARNTLAQLEALVGPESKEKEKRAKKERR